jgi:hypothetical protein
MDKVIAVLCVVVLAMTTVDGYDRMTGGDILGGNNEDNGQMSTITSVTVPESKIGDFTQYDHEILIEYRWENKTSGDYEFWALDVGGTETIEIMGTTSKKDGFGEPHDVMYLKRLLGAEFTVTADSSDDEPISAKGEYDLGRDEYTDLAEERIILTETDAWLKVDELPSTNIPLEFDAYMRSYFDPHEELKETLEESVLEDDRYIELGDSGTYEYWMGDFWSIEYQWVAEQGEIISGYETLFINVTTDLGDENFSLPFQSSLWYANDVAVPVKQHIRTSTYYEDDETLFYFIIENIFTIQVNGFDGGDNDIPWGTCDSTHWYYEHPDGEHEYWYDNYMPLSGSGFNDSSFDFKPEDAIAFLTTKDSGTNEYPSVELVDFLDSYNDIMVTRAEYSAEKEPVGDLLPQKKQGEYWWNLTFGHKRTEDDEGSSWELPYRYRLLVKQTSTFEALPEFHYEDEWEIEGDYGIANGTSPFSNWEISSDCLTMTSCEEILKTDDKVIEFFYKRPSGIVDDELSWGDVEGTGFVLEVSTYSPFGMDLIGTLTGIQVTTTSQYYWTLSKEDLAEGGTMASASIDVQTGQLTSILYIKGTALQGAFSD